MSVIHQDVKLQECNSALGAAIARNGGVVATGKLLGTSGPNVCRWSDDLTRWPVDLFLEFARRDKGLGDAVSAYVRNEQTERQHGEAVAALNAVLDDMGRHGRITALEAEIIADGQVNAKDRAKFLELEEGIKESIKREGELIEHLRAKIFPESRL